MLNLLGVGLFQVSVPAYLILQAYLAYAFHGAWRIAALIPLIFVAPLFLFSLYALGLGSSLWPLTLVLLTPVGLIYLVIVFAVHRFA
ncbi:MAG TPA: hypothetical protein VK779_05010 [Rhizomicrobium sp.]|jgi:hypothetical protein|nr:hypothetical protein [Rhizomicrobium sp.]